MTSNARKAGRARWAAWPTRVDLELFHRVAGWHVAELDRVLPRLSRAANHSRLWMGAALLLGLLGGKRGRRAALRGLVSIAIASPVANLPGKFGFRRARPPLGRVPVARRLARVPTSYAFPSGHSASAAAFALGASLEAPALAAPLGVVAGAVAFSRVYTGVHYPGDVAAGLAVGATAALLTSRLWPVTPPALQRPQPRAQPDREVAFGAARPACEVAFGAARPATAVVSPSGHGVAIVTNRASNRTTEDLLSELRRELPDAEVVEAADPEDLPQVLAEAAARSQVLGVAGGDGTVGAAAAAAMRAKVPLLIVPSGTFDHFARDAGVETLADAVAALRAGTTIAVRVGRAGDEVFVNTASLGGYPDLVGWRQRNEPRLGKWLAMAVGLLRTLARHEPLEVTMDGRRRRVSMVFVGNGRYEPEGFAPAWRERLDDDLLDVRIVDEAGWRSRLGLVVAMVARRLERSSIYERRLVDRFEVEFRHALAFAHDGEVGEARDRLTFEKLAEPLLVYAPVGDEAAPR